MLIGPVDDALERTDARQIVIVPEGELDRVRYGALSLRSGARLSDRRPIAVVPALAVFAELAARDDGAHDPAIGDVLLVGNPQPQSRPYSCGLPVPVLPALPHAGREARTIAAQYGGRPPLVGSAATRAAVLASMAGCEIAHFATHGFHGSDDVGASGALCLSSDGYDDGYLRADEIRQLSLPRCRLAVLSACRTGWGRSTYEGSLGLARTFLAAGVPAVVVSLWPVHDESTADLMIALHQKLRSGLSVGEALRRAMLQARAAGAGLRDWASFTIVGDPRVRLASPAWRT